MRRWFASLLWHDLKSLGQCHHLPYRNLKNHRVSWCDFLLTPLVQGYDFGESALEYAKAIFNFGGKESQRDLVSHRICPSRIKFSQYLPAQ